MFTQNHLRAYAERYSCTPVVLNGSHAMILVGIIAVWNQISYNFLFFLAGLQAIPKSVIEAAAMLPGLRVISAGPDTPYHTVTSKFG